MIMKMAATALTLGLSLTSLSVTNAYEGTLHGSKASFLMSNSRWMTLNYMHPNADKAGMRAAALANGDNSMYIYSRNGGDGFNGGPDYNLSVISAKPDWEDQLDILNNVGLKPVMWLTPDDSPNITNQSIAAQNAHVAAMVARFDGKVSGYVACLECDEYWSAEKTNQIVAHLKTISNKPVGVHLTTGLGGHKGDLNYYKNADYIFLQFGWDKTPAQVAAMVKDAIAKTGKPVIASEYAKESRSASAKALGEAACAAGAVGYGTGGTTVFCGHEDVTVEKEKLPIGSMVGGAIGLLVVGGIVWYLQDNYEFEIIMAASDNHFTYGAGKTINLVENENVTLDFNMQILNTEYTYRNDPRVLFSFSGTF